MAPARPLVREPPVAPCCLQVLGTVKDALLVAAGIVFLHENVSGLQLYGYSMSLMGFTAYNVIKAQQAAPAQHAQHGAAQGGSEAGGLGGPGAKGGELGRGGKGPGLLGDIEAGAGKGLAGGAERAVHVSGVAGAFADEGTKDK
jgi:hypothetical protein